MNSGEQRTKYALAVDDETLQQEGRHAASEGYHRVIINGTGAASSIERVVPPKIRSRIRECP